MAEPVLSVRNLNVRFRTGDGILHAVKGIDLDVAPGRPSPSSASPARARARP